MSEQENQPCAACGADSERAIWGSRVCYPCASDWRDRAPTHEDIVSKYGTDENSVAVYRAFTERWLMARKAKVA